MYIHEVPASVGMPFAMRHLRETESPSGIIVVQEIGHSIPKLRFRSADKPGSSIVLPDIIDVMTANRSRTDARDKAHDTEQIRCETLDAFVTSGIERWKKVIDGLGMTASVEVHYAENRREIENTRDSGLVIVPEKPQTEFVGYVATPDEIAAMERIASYVYDASEPDQAGLYV